MAVSSGSAEFGKLNITVSDKSNRRDISRRHVEWVSRLKSAIKLSAPEPEESRSKFSVSDAYNIPVFVHSLFEDGQLIESRLDMSEPLTPENYIYRFQMLLWIVEYLDDVEMHRYDMDDVVIERLSDGFEPDMHGPAESRASLSVGGQLLALRKPVGSIPHIHVGTICRVSANSISFKMAPSFNYDEDCKYDVTLKKLRTTTRRCHQAVGSRRNIPEVLFPETADPKQSKIQRLGADPEELFCFNDRLDQFQRQAVFQVLSARSRPAPYIIYGPPGTGKLVTLTECIFQIYKHDSRMKILVCANSNYRTNAIAKNLKNFGIVPERRLCRICAFHERVEDRDAIGSIMRTSNDLTEEEYSDFRVIITTCMQAGVLLEFDDRFDYVFIDEAGHASEPEALIPMQLVKPDGCVILAGDPKQLGPVCVHNTTAKLGLGKSLLERLSMLETYARQKDGTYNKDYITKLMISYRSDPRVMALNNELFYEGDLEFKNKTPTKWMTGLGVKSPIVFHPVTGEDQQVRNSWHNMNEVEICMDYVRKLYKLGLQPDQLGIITPYVNQIHKLQQASDKAGLELCKLASMEKFQGDEREIIIISTVRAFRDGYRSNLDFIRDPKRFNVGTSRAKWMLIIVGDQRALRCARPWSNLIERAHIIGSATD